MPERDLPVFYEESSKIFYLETKDSSYVMQVLSNGILCHSYYGAKIPREDLSYLRQLRELPCSPFMVLDGQNVSAEAVKYECPVFGRGDYRFPAVWVAGADGTCVNELRYHSHRIFAGKPEIRGMPSLDANTGDSTTLEILLKDEISGFDVVLSYTVFYEEDVLARHTRIINTAGVPVCIKAAASACLDFPTADYEMITLQGAWARERSVERYKLHHGMTTVESRRGASSHQRNPFAAIVGKNTDENQGEAYGFSLIYSGDFRIAAEVDHFDSLRMQLGLNPDTFCWQLKPGETFATPEAILTYSATGLNRMSQNFHRVCRNHLGKCADKTVKHPIVINNWEAIYYDLSEEKMERFITDCAGLGIDTVVMDDGWFRIRNCEKGSLGDWVVNRAKLPNGLKNLTESCRKNGMRFGIWLEPEMVSEDSDLYRAHPDWCIHTPGRVCVEGRNQLVLDLSRQEVVDHIYETIAKLLTENDISYIKWDMNRNITDNGSGNLAGLRQGEFNHRYILGLYQLLTRIGRAFPDVFIEGCAGGGGRFDFGMLYYMPQIWTSDDSDAMERLKIQYGTSYIYPTETMTAHVSACPNHQTGRTTSFAARGQVAQMCSFGYELDVGKLSEEEKELVRQQIIQYRRTEHLVNRGTYYRLVSPFDTKFCSWQLVSEDQREAVVLFAFPAVVPFQNVQYVKLQGLIPDRMYTVGQLDIRLSGSVLMQVGLPVVQPEEDNAVVMYELSCGD